jgi:hypothetical protein
MATVEGRMRGRVRGARPGGALLATGVALGLWVAGCAADNELRPHGGEASAVVGGAVASAQQAEETEARAIHQAGMAVRFHGQAAMELAQARAMENNLLGACSTCGVPEPHPPATAQAKERLQLAQLRVAAAEEKLSYAALVDLKEQQEYAAAAADRRRAAAQLQLTRYMERNLPAWVPPQSDAAEPWSRVQYESLGEGSEDQLREMMQVEMRASREARVQAANATQRAEVHRRAWEATRQRYLAARASFTG